MSFLSFLKFIVKKAGFILILLSLFSLGGGIFVYFKYLYFIERGPFETTFPKKEIEEERLKQILEKIDQNQKKYQESLKKTYFDPFKEIK